MIILGWCLVAVVAYIIYGVIGIAYINIRVRGNISESGKLRLEKDSLLYKYCCDWLGIGPKKISTCSLGACFLLVPFFYLVGLVVLVTVFGFFCPLSFVIGFFFAHRPPICSSKEFNEADVPWTPYKHWPRCGAHRIWPIIPLAILAALYGLGAFVWSIPSLSPTTQLGLGIGVVSAIVLAAIAVLFALFFRSESWNSMWQGFKDWKDGVCVEVELIEKSEEEKRDEQEKKEAAKRIRAYQPPKVF